MRSVGACLVACSVALASCEAPEPQDDSGLDTQDTGTDPTACDPEAATVADNEIPDPGFDQGLLCWGVFQAGEAGRGFQTDEDHPGTGQAPSVRADNDLVTTDTFRTQILTGDLPVQDGKTYDLSFFARAAEPRDVLVLLYEAGSLHSYLFQTEPIGTSWAQHSFVVTVDYTTADANFEIQMGQALPTVWLDDVRLAEQ